FCRPMVGKNVSSYAALVLSRKSMTSRQVCSASWALITASRWAVELFSTVAATSAPVAVARVARGGGVTPAGLPSRSHSRSTILVYSCACWGRTSGFLERLVSARLIYGTVSSGLGRYFAHSSGVPASWARETALLTFPGPAL